MLRKVLLITAAALAIITSASTISTPDANAGIKLNVIFGHGWHKYNGGYYDYYGSDCYWKKKRVKFVFWHHGHKH